MGRGPADSPEEKGKSAPFNMQSLYVSLQSGLRITNVRLFLAF